MSPTRRRLSHCVKRTNKLRRSSQDRGQQGRRQIGRAKKKKDKYPTRLLLPRLRANIRPRGGHPTLCPVARFSLANCKREREFENRGARTAMAVVTQGCAWNETQGCTRIKAVWGVSPLFFFSVTERERERDLPWSYTLLVLAQFCLMTC